MTTVYSQLADRFARIATIEEAASMLGWDEHVVMPPGGAGARADQLATLAGIAHQMLVAPETGDQLSAAEAAPPEDALARRNLELMRRQHTRAVALPPDLVEALARASSACEKTWREARGRSDFSLIAEPFGSLLALVREQAARLGDALDLAPYDALLDLHQPGTYEAAVAPVFARYESFLAEALPHAEAAQGHGAATLPGTPPFPEDVQEALCRRLAARAGLDFDSSRLDRSAHPFSGGTPTDIRITTRYDSADFASAVMGVLHETGHALYEAGLPRAMARQPVGAAAGMAAHESQSLIIEMQASRSDAFLAWLGPELARAFGQDAPAFAPERLKARLRRVERSLIRVEADELTYPAHVILRFRLERALIAGDLAVADLSAAWREGMRALLGIEPPDDRQGCLQDIHWYSGAFGYFPSYTLGAMAAAQLMAAARQAVPGLDASLEDGNFAPLVSWLREAVHAHGARYGFDALLTVATGDPLNASHFEAHLRARYLNS